MKIFPVLWRGIRATYDDLLLYVVLTVYWWIGTIPVLFAFFAFMQAIATGDVIWWLGVLLGIALSPISSAATAGLHRVANRAANYKRIDASFFWEGVRMHLKKGWLLYAGNLVAIGGVLLNIQFYLRSPSDVMRLIGIAWIWGLLLLFLMGQYFFPLFWQQDEPRLRLILRNSLVLTFRYPLFTFILLLYQIVTLAVSVGFALLLFLITPALLAVTTNVAVVHLLQDMGLLPPPPDL
jgi:hypothetical protein